MIKVKAVGFTAATALMLALAACNSAPDASPAATAAPAPTEQAPSGSPAPAATIAPSPEATPEPQATEDPGAPEEGTPRAALEAAATVVKALKNGNMETLAAWAHKDRGVRFSPYAYVQTERDIVLSRDELAGAMKDPLKRNWGESAGSGESMTLTFADYYKQYVYDVDFAGLAEILLNESTSHGTTINNVNEVYPKATHDYVEYYIKGIDPAAEGMDWRSLRLVFEKNGQDPILVAIIHDQWTP
ncbi:hypothetical protein [Paenibacillus sp. MMS20-IR301]|uniref:hypothetical protein n=1 Tax=Paenibacillus sp. MMS20-IR301 TaxID=2895946 RepID=UPI0028EBE645|nr:hypothetical protein [Paenibacillus sp. MMS20-IR301]WNS41108.1 hypothetical protein LOS79_18905 [Paenibacillus sp. MMS20-IR301]